MPSFFWQRSTRYSSKLALFIRCFIFWILFGCARSLPFPRPIKAYQRILTFETWDTVVFSIDQQFDSQKEKPLLVFDAGISTEENLNRVREKYDYVCVSRSTAKEFSPLSGQATQLHDNKGNNIQVSKVKTENE